MMEDKILGVLSKFDEQILSYDGDNLFDDDILNSLQVISLVANLEDKLDIEIDAKYILEENFKTKEAIVQTVKDIMEKE